MDVSSGKRNEPVLSFVEANDRKKRTNNKRSSRTGMISVAFLKTGNMQCPGDGVT